MTVEWVVLETIVDLYEDEKVRVTNWRKFQDKEDEARHYYTLVVKEFSGDMRRGCLWVDLYLEARLPRATCDSKMRVKIKTKNDAVLIGLPFEFVKSLCHNSAFCQKKVEDLEPTEQSWMKQEKK